VNAWTAAALVLLAGAAPLCLLGASSGRTARRLAALALLSTVVGAVFLLLPQGYDRSSYQDMALVLGVLSPTGTLVFTRFVTGESPDADSDGGHGDGGHGDDHANDGHANGGPQAGRSDG
jgi:multisubunit Na+/H+ antiporter MnhF subunit